MTINLTKITLSMIIVGFIVATVSPLLTLNVNATASLYIESSSSTVNKGDNVYITVRSNTDVGYNSADINISFTPGTLTYVEYDNAGSTLPSDMSGYSGLKSASTVKYVGFYAGGSSTPGNGLKVVTFVFNAHESGQASIVLDSSSAIAGNNGTFVVYGSGSSTVQVNAPTPTPSPAPTPTPTPTPIIEEKTLQPYTDSSPEPTKQTEPDYKKQDDAQKIDKTPPEIKSIHPLGFVDDLLNIKVKTNEPTKITIKAGVSKDQLIISAQSPDGFDKSHFVVLGNYKSINAESDKIFYQVIATDEAGNSTTSEIKELSTPPVSVLLTMKNSSGKLIRNKTFIVNGKEYKTDSNGVLKIDGLIPGNVIVTISYNGKELFVGEVTAVAGLSDQAFEIIATEDIDSGLALLSKQNLVYTFSALLLLVVGVIVYLQLRKAQLGRRETRLHSLNPYGNRAKNILQKNAFNSVETLVVSPASTANSTSKQAPVTISPSQTSSPPTTTPVVSPAPVATTPKPVAPPVSTPVTPSATVTATNPPTYACSVTGATTTTRKIPRQ